MVSTEKEGKEVTGCVYEIQGIAFGLGFGTWGLMGGGDMVTTAYSKSVFISLV